MNLGGDEGVNTNIHSTALQRFKAYFSDGLTRPPWPKEVRAGGIHAVYQVPDN